jgi:hypothetical protein
MLADRLDASNARALGEVLYGLADRPCLVVDLSPVVSAAGGALPSSSVCTAG